MSVDDVLSALASVPELHRLRPGASDEEIDAAERTIGRRLPASFRALYRFSNGGELVGGNLMFEPLTAGGEDELSLVTASARLREWEWNIPEELVMFGGNGGDESFGLWLPEGGDPERAAVIQVGETFDERGLAVIGTSFERFLRGWMAYYLALEEEPEAAARLGVPPELAALPDGGSDEEFVAMLGWADPDLPDPDPDPYEKGLDADGVRALLAGR